MLRDCVGHVIAANGARPTQIISISGAKITQTIIADTTMCIESGGIGVVVRGMRNILATGENTIVNGVRPILTRRERMAAATVRARRGQPSSL